VGRIRPDNPDRVARFFGDIHSYPNLAGADGMKYGKIAQLRNILRWLQNYHDTGCRLCVVSPSLSDEQIRERERKLRADNFNAPENVDVLIDELESIVIDYEIGMELDQIQLEWNLLRPKLTSIFHEKRVLPKFLVKRLPSNE